MSSLKQNFLFIALLVSLFWLMGFNNYYSLAPDSFHLGAQTDRASIALNYTDGSADFLYPKIMETRLSDGIVGCEFPGLYYLLAQVFKQTGFSYAIYRVCIWGFYLLALFSMFKITRLYFNFTTSALLALFIGLSPILSFYALNFLSDVPAMGLSLFGWWMVLRKRRNKFSLIIGFLVFGLAGLLKASYAMHIAVAFSIFIIENRKIKWEVLVSALIGLGCIAAWYEWATHLNTVFQNPHFLLKPNPANSFPDFLDLIKSNWANWSHQLYKLPSILLLLYSVYTLFKGRKEQKVLFKVGSRLLVFWIAFYLLFQTQFKYHDYYFIAVYPLLFFLALGLLRHCKTKMNSLFIPTLILFFLVIQNFGHGKSQLAERHKVGSYFYQPPMPGVIEKYVGIDTFLDNHISKDAKIVTIFDNNPNSTLFFARRKGCRIARDFSDDLVKEIITDTSYHYLLVNQTEEFDSVLSHLNLNLPKPIAEANGIYLFENTFNDSLSN